MSFEEFVPGRSWRGLKQIKLDSGSSHGIQQRLGYWVYRQFGQPASRQSSCRFVLNLGGSDDYRGCYGVEEVIKKAFVRYRWPNLTNPQGNLYKLDNQASTWSVDSYRWRGTDPSQYVPIPFSPKTNEVGGNYGDLVNLCNVLNNVPLSSRRTELERIMNVDRQLAVLAVCSTVADSDGLFNNMRELNNHYWYHREDTNKLEVIPWDVDGSFVYQPSDTSAWKWFYETRPSQGGNNPSVLNAWIPNDRVARESFVAKVRQVVAGPLSSARSRADFIYNQIKSHVYADPYKPITNAEFDARVQAVKDWIPRRITFLQTETAVPTVTIAAVDGAGSEPGSNTLSFRVSRTGATSAPLTVDLTIGGTATNGTDYNTLATSVTISRGQGSVTVTVTPKDDTVSEGSETIALAIAGHPSYTVGTASSATLTLADNDSTPTLPTVTIVATDNAAAEPTATGFFTVTRTGATTAALAVQRARSGTATSVDDFAALPSPITIPAGQASVTVTVTPVDDALVEGSETVILTISPDPAYTVGTASSATVTIADNDTTPTLPTVTIVATDNTAAEPTATGFFTVTRTGATTAALTVTLATSGSASSGADYAALPTTLTIPAGQASATVTVTPVNNTTPEGNETVVLTISPNAAYTVGAPSNATVTIADDDGAGGTTVSFQDGAAYAGTRDTAISQNTPTVNQGTNATVKVDGDDVAGTDIVALLRWDLASIPPGSVLQSAAITLNVSNSTLQTFEVYQARRAWTEMQATWADAAAGTPWQEAGAQGAQDRGTTVLGTLAPTAMGAYALNLNGAGVAVVQSWVDAPGTNYGFVIAHPTNGDGVVFDSREAGVPANRPKLTVTYGPGTAGTGLSATYYDNLDFTGTSVTRTDPAVDFNWADGSPAPAIGPDTFSARWTGRVRAGFSETYTFYTFTNDGVRLWVEGELLVDQWVQQSGGIEWSAQIALEAGKSYTVQMDYYENVGNGVARLLWSGPSIPKQVVPQSALDPTLGPPDSRDNDEDGIPNDADLDDDNDGIPDLQDSDRDGDGASNVVEAAGGTDPDDRTSAPAAGGSGGGGGGGGGCGATGLEALLVLALLVVRRPRIRA